MQADLNEIVRTVLNVGTRVALQLIGAFVMWIVGRRLIDLAMRLVSRAMARQAIDTTLVGYVTSSLSVLLNVVLVVAILGFFDVETTSFAAVLAAGGVAIGVAWSGMLANFAAGAFLIILRPFKVGDFVTAGGVTGSVAEIGLFGSVINTPDNVRTIIGNNKIFSDTIHNYSANPYRRVDLVAQLNHGADHKAAIRLLKERVSKIPSVLADPPPSIEILESNLAGPVLCVRPNCQNKDYWQVYFDTNRLIRETFGEAGFPAPEQHYAVRNPAPAASA
jgi:small conductance mechanosensitive channel